MKKTLSKDGTLIAFDQSGQGPALILVTGAIARRTDAARLAASLSPNFTVISYDRRGRGESGDTPPYAVEREVEDLERADHRGWRSGLRLWSFLRRYPGPGGSPPAPHQDHKPGTVRAAVHH